MTRFQNIRAGGMGERNKQHPQRLHENLRKPPHHPPVNLIHLWMYAISASKHTFFCFLFLIIVLPKKTANVTRTQGSSPLPASLQEG